MRRQDPAIRENPAIWEEHNARQRARLQDPAIRQRARRQDPAIREEHNARQRACRQQEDAGRLTTLQTTEWLYGAAT